MADYVKVYESQPERPTCPAEAGWLDELLNANHIPFRTSQTPAWTGWSKAPEYKERTEYYVPDTCAYLARELIEQDSNEDAVLWDEGELFPEGAENQLPQVTCPRCGKAYDMDYPTCPFCT